MLVFLLIVNCVTELFTTFTVRCRGRPGGLRGQCYNFAAVGMPAARIPVRRAGKISFPCRLPAAYDEIGV